MAPQSKTQAPRPRRGFTLLEILIAMVLTSTLMVVVWSLFHTFTRLEERSAQAAVELQLVRSLSQHFRTDVEHFASLALPSEIVRINGSKSRDDTEEESADADESENSSEPAVDTEDDLADGADEEDLSKEPSAEDAISELNDDGTRDAITVAGQPFDTNVNDFDVPELSRDELRQRQEFNSSLLEKTYLRGNATRLEIVTRMPYTVDVPTGSQILGAETRYGTHQLVVYEWRDARQLDTLLRDDPVLNPAKFKPPPPDPFRDPRLPPVPAPFAAKLNPNDSVGLIREVKSWLHFSRDRRKDALKKQAEAAGILVDGKLPWELNPNQSLQQSSALDSKTNASTDADADMLSMWLPPPEFRHRRDHIPEVTKLQFRYFDGEAWRLDWNNNDALPLAIEVAFDLDPAAPATRAKEFEDAHAAMLGGANLTDFAPDEETEEDVFGIDGLDALSKLNLDPTAIITEYRFVVRIPAAIEERRDREGADSSDDGREGESEELSFELGGRL